MMTHMLVLRTSLPGTNTHFLLHMVEVDDLGLDIVDHHLRCYHDLDLFPVAVETALRQALRHGLLGPENEKC